MSWPFENPTFFFKKIWIALDTEFKLTDVGYTLLRVHASPSVRDITLLLQFVWGWMPLRCPLGCNNMGSSNIAGGAF